jgi:hypothetical protein
MEISGLARAACFALIPVYASDISRSRWIAIHPDLRTLLPLARLMPLSQSSRPGDLVLGPSHSKLFKLHLARRQQDSRPSYSAVSGP